MKGFRILDEAWSSRATDIAFDIGERILDPQKFGRDYLAAVQGLENLEGRWDPSNLSEGCTGSALLLAALAKLDPSKRWRDAVHQHLALAIAHRTSSHTRFYNSLYGGASGLLVALRYASDDRKYYQSAIESVSLGVERSVANIPTMPARQTLDFDIMYGVAGVVLALRHRTPAAALTYLSWLCEEPERWKVPLFGSGDPRPVNNLGLSHGVPGMLSALCLYTNRAEHMSSKKKAANFILTSGIREGNSLVWHPTNDMPVRPAPRAWCYGTPGVVNALWIAAQHLKRKGLEETVNNVWDHLAATNPDVEFLEHGLCHGTIGLALCAAVYARRTGARRVADLSEHLAQVAITAFAPQSHYGYTSRYGTRSYDCNGFLRGAAGIALGLLTLATDVDDAWLTDCLALPSRAESASSK